MALCAHFNFFIFLCAADLLELFKHKPADTDHAEFGKHAEALELGNTLALVHYAARTRRSTVNGSVEMPAFAAENVVFIQFKALVNALFVIGRYNDLATRPVPNFFRREGANNARS